MIEHVSEALLAALFAIEASAPDTIIVTEPIKVDATLEASGIDFGGTLFVVFFTDVVAYADYDEPYIRETAMSWNGGVIPAPNSRLVKFLRADANRDTMFLPEAWPLPHPAMIWQFSEVLGTALVAHAEAFSDISQYFYFPQTARLDALCNRLAKKFERGELGIAFRCVTRPASDEGGFYGFERI